MTNINTSDFTPFYNKKISTIRKTAYIRFDLAERLQIINYINLVTSLVMTTYLSGWAIFIAFFPEALGTNDRNLISYIAVMATIALMLLTLLDYMADRSVKAKIFLQCGNTLLQIADDLEHAVEQRHPPYTLKSLVDKYNHCLSECPLNHSTEDNKLYVLKQQLLDSKGFKKNIYCYSALLFSSLAYYAKRISLQLLVTLMVIIPSVSILSEMTP